MLVTGLRPPKKTSSNSNSVSGKMLTFTDISDVVPSNVRVLVVAV